MSKRWNSGLLALGVAVAVGLTGCTVKPEIITAEDRTARVDSDLTQLFVGQEEVSGAISLAEAMARALKYNMDHRVKMMEYAVAERNLGIANVNLLPHILIQAGYNDRSNYSGARSLSLLDFEESLEPSTSQERSHDTSDVQLIWNALDFGVSYLTAKQRNDEIFIAEERRRKAVQNIIQDVIDAFWRAYSAQNLVPDMELLMTDVNQAIDSSKDMVASGQRRREESLEYQRALFDTRAQLWEMRERLDLAKTRLATLMNLRPGTQYRLIAPKSMVTPISFSTPMERMERFALVTRPELREEDYRKRISQLDVKKSMIRMFPNLELKVGSHSDSNRFLFNGSWSDMGLRLFWDLFNFADTVKAKKFREAQVELADVRRMSLSMAVVTQVRLAVQRYELSRTRYGAAMDLALVNMELADITEENAETKTLFDRIRSRATRVSSLMRKDLAFAETQNAMARVLNSIGVDPLPEAMAGADLGTVTGSIKKHWKSLANDLFGGEMEIVPTVM